MNNVMPNQLEPRMIQKMCDILFSPREEIVEANHFITTFDQPIAQVASQKSSTAGDKYGAHDSPVCVETRIVTILSCILLVASPQPESV